MGRFIAALFAIFLIAGPVQAKSQTPRNNCGNVAKLYFAAASMRDQGKDRDMIFYQLLFMAGKVPGYYVEENELYNIADSVYYSAEFADKSGEPLKKAIERQCLQGKIADVFMKR